MSIASVLALIYVAIRLLSGDTRTEKRRFFLVISGAFISPALGMLTTLTTLLS